MTATKSSKPASVVVSDETAKQLFDAVKENPRETDLELRLVDRLQECGVAPKTAKKFAHEHRLFNLPLMEWDAAERRKFLKGTSVEEIQRQLDATNGARRERTLDLSDVLGCIKYARRNGYSWVGGGTVANAYKYAAYQTGCVVAVATNGKLRVRIATLSAKKSASITNQLAGITARGTVADYRAWADAAQAVA